MSRAALPFGHVMCDGMVCDPMAHPELIHAHRRDFCPRPDDLFVATYMKSGTLWTLQLIRLLLTGGVPERDGRNLFERFPILEETDGAALEAISSPRVIHSHLPPAWLAGAIHKERPARYLVVLRDPRDVAVSLYVHMRGRTTYRLQATWPEFLALFMAGEVPYGRWTDHARGWWERRHQPGVLLQSFARRKRDPEGAARELAAFMGLDLTDVQLQQVVHHSAFEQMKRDPLANGAWLTRLPDTDGHLRRGVVGDWANHFSPAQDEAMTAWLDAHLQGQGALMDFLAGA